MVIFLISFVGIFSIVISRNVFSRWFNHVSIYAFSWMMMLILYNLKLLDYYDLIWQAWFIIIIGFTSFFMGSLVVVFARKVFQKDFAGTNKNVTISFLSDNGKALKYALVIISFIALLGAIQNWLVLIKGFGSIEGVLVHANLVYSMRIRNEIPGQIPYISGFGFAGIVLAGIYSGYKNKITLISLIPFIAVVLKSLSSFGRVGMLMALVQFVGSFLFVRYALSKQKSQKKEIKLSSFKTIASVVVAIVLIVASASLVKVFRHTYENFKSASGALRSTKSDIVISPSIYLYLSSHVGVLSEYLKEGTEKNKYWGENTFAPIYNFLAKFKLNKEVSIYLKNYFIPMGTNTATYLKEIHADFGNWGVFIFPFLLGLLATYFWYNFLDTGNYFMLIGWVYVFTIIGLSFFTMVTRGADWYLSLVILLITFPIINKYSIRNKAKIQLLSYYQKNKI